MVINQSTQDGKTYTYPPQTHMGSSNNNNNNMNNNVYYMAEPAGPSVMMPQQPQPQPQQPAPVYHYPQQQQPQPHYNPFAANASAGLVFGSPQPHAMQPGMVPQQQQQQQQQPIPFQMQSTVPYHPQLQQHPQPQYAQQAYVVQPSVYGVSVVNSNQSYENPSEDQNSLLFFILGFFFNIFWVIGACTYSGSRSTTARRYAKYSRNLCILVTVLVLASIAINFAVFLVEEYH